MFPKTGELVSPDGRFLIRSSEREGSASDFVGTFHSLWLVETATSHSRKLCDYLGLAAVAWSNNDVLIMTEYARTTSRVFVFSASGRFPGDNTRDSLLLDKSALIKLVPPDLRDTLRGNDRTFVEASSLQNGILELRVWGHGQHDPSGFRWHCEYTLSADTISCGAERAPHVEKTAPTR